MNKNKEVFFLINSLGGGGAEGVCVNLANSLCDRGWRVTLVVLHLNNAVRQKDLKEGVYLVVLGKNHARTALIALANFLRHHKPKKILVFNHQLAVLLVLLRVVLLFDFKIIARNINTLSQKKAGETSFWHKHIVQGLTKLFYGKVDRVIAQSQGMAEDLVCFYGVTESKIKVIYNPVANAIKNYHPTLQPEKKDYLLCVGRLEEQKSFHYAISAFAAIAPYYPNLRLKIVGKGSLESKLKEQAHTLGVADRVDFEGYQTDMIPYYLNAKATLLTSLYEGFPNVLVESIALGTPLVAFDCQSGPSEIVVVGVNGYLVKNKNIEHLKECMKTTLSHVWNVDSIVETSKRFSRVEILDKYEKVLLEGDSR